MNIKIFSSPFCKKRVDWFLVSIQNDIKNKNKPPFLFFEFPNFLLIFYLRHHCLPIARQIRSLIISNSFWWKDLPLLTFLYFGFSFLYFDEKFYVKKLVLQFKFFSLSLDLLKNSSFWFGVALLEYFFQTRRI